jgi:hypothetical protein
VRKSHDFFARSVSKLKRAIVIRVVRSTVTPHWAFERVYGIANGISDNFVIIFAKDANS